MSRWGICLFIILFVCPSGQSFAQQGFDTSDVLKINVFNNKVIVPRLAINGPNYNKPLRQIQDRAALILLKPLPANYYCNALGYFCTKELQVEKAIRLPLRFRLGSVQYTNYLEGKSQH